MSTTVVRHTPATRSTRAGTVTVVLATMFALAVAYTYALSLIETFNPPDWVRLVGLAWLPIGLGGVPVAYLLAREGPGRGRGRAGVAISVVALVALVALVVALG